MSTSTIPLWGRAWKLTIKYQQGDALVSQEVLTQSSWDPESLRMTFDVLQSTIPSPYWFADISIYNLNKTDEKLLNNVFNAKWVTLEAGFQSEFSSGQSSIIWDGPVIQVLFDREDVVDQRITFHCLATIPEIENNIVNLTIGPLATQAQAIQQMMDSIGAPGVQMGPKAQAALESKQYPFGLTLFGKASKYIAQLADSNFMNHWNNGKQVYISEITSPSATPNLIYAPTLPPNYTSQTIDSSISYSLIGTPRQTQFGPIYTVLLDARMKVGLPPLLVKLDQVVISQMAESYPWSFISPIDPSGLSVVGKVHHYGDTRGNDWTTEVTGYWRNYTTNLLNGVFNAQ